MSDEEESVILPWKGKPATIILINAFGGTNTAERALVATCQMFRRYLRASSDQLLGVCIYGVEKSSTSLLETKSVIDLTPLNEPTLENLKIIQNFNLNTLVTSKELVLSDVLWHCQTLFTNLKRQISSSNIIILSRLEIAPTKTDEEITLNRVRKLVDLQINIKLINISENEYKIHNFYKDFIVEASRSKDILLPMPLWDPNEIELLMVQHSNRHLAVAQINLNIGDDVSIAVGVYNILKSYETTKPKTVKINRYTNALVKGFNQKMKMSEKLDEDMDVDDEEKYTKAPLLKSEILHTKVFADKTICFTDDEMKMIRNPFGPPIIKLLGFKPANYMSKEKWFLKSGYFLYPNEKEIEGSTVTFKALYKACDEMSVVAICMLCTRVDYRPQLVALLPCSQPFNLKVDIGFDVIPIPFKENLKDVPVPDDDDNDDENDKRHKTIFKNLFNNLLFDYKPDLFENPRLQNIYQALEVKKIGCDVEPFTDSTERNSETFDNLEDDVFYEYFGPFGPVAAKRDLSSKSESAVNSKKSKIEGYDENFVQERISNYTVDKFTKSDLIEILKRHGVEKVSSTLKKPELVKLVYSHCSKR